MRERLVIDPLCYSGRVFEMEDFQVLDFAVSTRPMAPGEGLLLDGTWVTVVQHPDKPGRWAELVKREETMNETPQSSTWAADLERVYGEEPWVLLEHADPKYPKPYHLEPQARFMTQLPASPGYHFVATYSSMKEAVDAFMKRMEQEHPTPEAQIEKLAAFIIREIPGEPGRSEGAVDTAIRVMQMYRKALRSVMFQLHQLVGPADVVTPIFSAYEKARRAHSGEWEYNDEGGDTNGSGDNQG
jgi:hypothetical protein